ncbi:ribonuclease D [Gallibacterium anatis]|uniref:ribonuclease D n=1 Tax=Gallibacterium anatis TaxID=750 RepID=UPI000531E1C9|nr:ribonuclease D [Gallibacterium anatis]KGQ43335.1 ribonuclease D [Gallibacterium anatis]KGQ48288.1 ribonuclease D [Gallibacterium anatis]KGQ51274.1 ribonuclease D [Gallibacterium anatis 10672-6]KGQ56735.1 ribonuclease D [Gallibacterium anatis]
MISYQIIQQDAQLKQLCEQARHYLVVALDTEFERVRSYYAKLGLIQLYFGADVALIDPLTITDWQPFIALLADANVLKILHASGEDIEIFHQQFQQIPAPMLDTQIMANFLGFPQSAGFALLAQHYLQVELDKKASRTDWLKRPLSERQLNYAAADVYYLLPIYQKMAAAMASSEWKTAIQQECELFAQKRCRQTSPEKAYLDIGNAWRLNRKALNNLKFLAKWRFQEGIKRNIALNFIVSSEGLVQMAIHEPVHTAQLLDLGLHPMEIKRYGKKLLLLLEQAKRVPPEQYPDLIENISERPHYKKYLNLLHKELKAMLQNKVPLQLVASKKALHQFLKWYWVGQSKQKLPDLLCGWRAVYGEKLLHSLKAAMESEN